MMKKIICLVLGSFLIFSALAFEDDKSVMRTEIQVTFDRNSPDEAVLTIDGENLHWSKTIKYNDSVKDNETGEVYGLPATWNENLEILMVREFGNYTDVQYEILRCNEMANFSNQWLLCRDQRDYFELQMMNNMINKTIYDDDVSNLTIERNNWENKYNTETTNLNDDISTLTKKNTTLTQQRNYGWLIGIAGLAVGGYLLYRYKGFGKRKSQEEKEFPRDHSI